MKDDKREILRNAEKARKAGDLYRYFTLGFVASEVDQMVFGPWVTRGPGGVRE